MKNNMNLSDLTNEQRKREVNLKGYYWIDIDGELRDEDYDWVVPVSQLVGIIQKVEKRKIEYMEAEIRLRKKLMEALEN